MEKKIDELIESMDDNADLLIEYLKMILERLDKIIALSDRG